MDRGRKQLGGVEAEEGRARLQVGLPSILQAVQVAQRQRHTALQLGLGGRWRQIAQRVKRHAHGCSVHPCQRAGPGSQCAPTAARQFQFALRVELLHDQLQLHCRQSVSPVRPVRLLLCGGDAPLDTIISARLSLAASGDVAHGGSQRQRQRKAGKNRSAQRSCGPRVPGQVAELAGFSGCAAVGLALVRRAGTG